MTNIRKVSLLCSKPVKNINPELIGWKRPDGRINFANNESAKKYAINRCFDALNQDKKFERAIIVKDNVIIAEIDGTAHGVELKDFWKHIKDIDSCDVYHDHPLPIPLSNEDHNVLLTQNSLKSVTAINKNRNFSTMVKLPFPRIKYLPQKLNRLFYLAKYNILANFKYLDIAAEYTREINTHSKILKNNYRDKSYKEILNLVAGKKIINLMEKMGIALDEMWKEYAYRVGVKYESGKL